MKGSEAKMMGFMEGADKRFVIPVYQRKYDWKYDIVLDVELSKNKIFADLNMLMEEIQTFETDLLQKLQHEG